jgi:ketosteroid isomerase-like protein
MSENLDLLRSIYAEWEHGDFRAQPGWADPDIEVEVPDGPEPSTRTGIAAAPGIEDFLTLSETLSFDAEEYRQLDDGSVLVISRMRGRGKDSGVEVDQRRASLFHIGDGKVIRLALYWNRARALAPTSALRSRQCRRITVTLSAPGGDVRPIGLATG